MKYEGYERRKLELEVTKRFNNEQISEETYENLNSLLEEDKYELVYKALYDDSYKLGGIEEDKVKPDPLNLSWEEIWELEETMKDEMNISERYDEERYKNLESIYEKARNAQ